MSIYGDLMNLSKTPKANQPQGSLPAKDRSSSPTQKTTAPRTFKKEVKKPIMVSRHHDTKHDTMTPRHHDAIIELIRSAVKTFGKEAATHRFTLEEKKAVAD